MRAALIALSLGVCVAVAGCGRSSEHKTVVYSGPNGSVAVTSNGQHMVIHSADNKSTVEFNGAGMGSLRMPDFAPLFPGAKVTTSVNEASATGGGAMVAFTVTAAPADVIAFYRQKAASAGFSETFNMSQGDTMSFMANSKDKKSVQVTASKTGGATQAQVIWSSGG